MSEPVALTSTPNTGTFDVAIMFAFEAGEADNSGVVKNPVPPTVPVPVEQDTPVVELNPVADAQPAGKFPTGDEQDKPVVVLNPAVDVQPAGKLPAGVTAEREAFNACLVCGPTWFAGTNPFDS